jgi:uncharacterized protein YjbJ (UPF0337 family)
MNKEQLSGQFDQIKGKIKETWGRLSDDDIALLNGQQDQFYGKLKEYYGLSRENAEEQIKKLRDFDRAA